MAVRRSRGPGGISARTEIGRLIQEVDWSRTGMGSPDTWPASLRSHVCMLLEMPTPAMIFWGRDLIQLYNDAYIPIMGTSHPTNFAARYPECCPDSAPEVQTWMQGVIERGDSVRLDERCFILRRYGFAEEAYFTLSLSPLRDDRGAIAGIFQPAVEVTDSVLRSRRSEIVRRLCAQTDTPDTAMNEAVRVLAESERDIPFALLYLWDAHAGALVLTAHPGLARRDAQALEHEGIPRVALQAFTTRNSIDVDHVSAALGRDHTARGSEPTQRAQVLPLQRFATDTPRGVVVLGANPRQHFDEQYREFMGAVARELAASFAVEQAKRTERRLVARELAAKREAELQKEHLLALLTQAPTPIAVLRGPDLVLELANACACKVWMREQHDLIGRPLFEALPDLRGHGLEATFESVRKTGEAFVGRELPFRLSAPDGTVTDSRFDFVYAPMRTAAGDIDGILMIGFDVTEQVRAREQLDGLKRAAEAANLAKDEFFAALGHELRNPLAPILTALELMRMRGVGEAERERKVIERQADHLVRLVDDLLDVSRIVRGKVELRRERVELSDVVARGVEMALPLIEQRRHELVVRVPRRGLTLEVDPGRIAQALGNLLTNAAKYTEPGGRITIASRRRSQRIDLSVRDTGIGIEPHMLPHVFEAFVQERQALDRSRGGLGLGLAIVRGIAELHGGAVKVRSDGHGKGSEFILRLPVRPADTAQAPVRRMRVPELGDQARSILVVDDNEDAAYMLAHALDLAGHRTRIAHDGPAALRIASESPPDVALLDIGLPVMDGYELAQRLRELPALHHVPLVAVTGYGQDSDRKRSRAAGFDVHLVKPVDLGQVETVVRSLTRPSAPQAPG